MPLNPSGHTPTSSPADMSRSASGVQASVLPCLRASDPIPGSRNMRSAPSIRRWRFAGCSSCRATAVISESSGRVPEWLATTSAPPSAGTWCMPMVSTRNHVRYSGRSAGSSKLSVRSASNPKSSTA